MSALPVISVFRKGEEIKSLPVVDDILVGRGDACIIRLDDKAVSRNHALFRRVGADIEVEKKSEFAPVIVNGEDCVRKTLKNGDVVEIGPYRVKISIPVEQKKEEPRDGPIGVEEVSGMESESENDGATSILNVDFTQNSSRKGKKSSEGGGELFSFDQKKSLKRQREENDSTGIAEGTFANEPVAEEDATRIQNKAIEARLQVPDGYAAQTSYDLADGTYTIGRGKGCDVVLLDKKSSRKNSEIRKDGNRFVIRDLDSSNGTFVNGRPIKEQELYHDDLIRVGEAQIRFLALNKNYEQKRDQIENPGDGAHTNQIVVNMPTENSDVSNGGGTGSGHMMAPEFDPADGLGSSDPGYSAIPNPTEQPAPAASERPANGLNGLIEKYVKGYKDLKPVQKLIPILFVAGVAFYFFEEELLGTPPPEANPAAQNGKNPNGKKPGGPIAAGTAAGATGPNGAPGTAGTNPAVGGAGGDPSLIKSYASLGPEDKQYVDTQMQLADDAFKAQDYDKALFEVKKIYRILPDYDRAKEIERYSKSGKRILEVKAEEKRKKEEAERVKARTIEVVASAEAAMQKKDYEAAKPFFDEIMQLDPENKRVGEWKKEIQAVQEEKDRQAMIEKVEKEKNQAAADLLSDAMKLFTQKKYHEAIPAFERVADVRASDTGPEEKAEKMKKASAKAIRDLRDPFLRKAKAAEGGGDLAEAYKNYERATQVDPPHPEGYHGMERIRETLNQKAREIYLQAIVQESYSDFKGAYQRFKQILDLAPENSEYWVKAKKKLRAYLNYTPEDS